jgi:hypothetical protein
LSSVPSALLRLALFIACLRVRSLGSGVPDRRQLQAARAPGATVSIMVATRVAALAGAFGLVVSAVACASGESGRSPQRLASDAQQAGVSGECPHAPRELAAVLRKALRREGELQRLFALRSKASFSDKDPDVRSGVYFVSGNIGAMVLTWAVNVPAWQTGAGLILAVDHQTRAVSPPQWIVSPRLLETRYGISEHTDGYARARACANPTRH